RHAARRLDRGLDPLDRVAELVEAALAVVVLDRAADGAGLGGARDGEGGGLRLGAVAVLEVDRDREVGGAIEFRDVRDDLVERDVAVEPAEREREAGARGRERAE